MPTPNHIDDNNFSLQQKLVTSVLAHILSDLWYEKHPYYDIDKYTFEFQNFCKSVLYSALNKSAK